MRDRAINVGWVIMKNKTKQKELKQRKQLGEIKQ